MGVSATSLAARSAAARFDFHERNIHDAVQGLVPEYQLDLRLQFIGQCAPKESRAEAGPQISPRPSASPKIALDNSPRPKMTSRFCAQIAQRFLISARQSRMRTPFL